MPNAPAVLPALPSPAQVAQPAEARARPSLSPATLRAHQVGWQAFLDWCALAGRQALPAAPATVADHLASLAKRLSATPEREAIIDGCVAPGRYRRTSQAVCTGSGLPEEDARRREGPLPARAVGIDRKPSWECANGC